MDLGKYYFYLKQNVSDSSDWRNANNEPIFIHFAWYNAMGLPIPNYKNFARKLSSTFMRLAIKDLN